MAINVGGISVKITADTTGFQAGLNRVNRKVSDASKELRASANEYGKWAAAGTAAATAIGASIFKSTSENIRLLKTQAQVANTSTQELQKMAYAARSVNVDIDKLSDILKDVNDRIGDFGATGAGTMVDFFENIAPKVGVTYENFKNLSGKDALQLYVTSLEKANVSQADMTFYMEAIASDSTRLIPLLKDSGNAMTAMALEADKLGVVLSDIDLAKVESANAQLDKSSLIIGSAIQSAVVSLSPLVSAIAEHFNNLAIEAGGFGNVFDDVITRGVKVAGVFANGLHGIEIIIKSVKLTTNSLGAAVVEFARIMTVGIEQTVNVGIAGINKLIQTVNTLPSVSIPMVESFTFGAATLFTDLSNDAIANVKNIASELHQTLMQPLPSNQFDEFLKNAREKSQAAAEELSKSTSNAAGGGGSNLNSLEQQQLDERIEAIKQGLLTEQELKAEAYLADIDAINQKRETDLQNAQYYNDLEVQLAQKHADDIIAINDRLAAREKEIEEIKRKAMLRMTVSAFRGLSSLMNTESRKLFEIGKVAAYAETVVTGAVSAQKAYKGGLDVSGGNPLVGAAFAAASLASTAVQLKQIQSTQFGSAGGGQSIQSGQVVNNVQQQQQPDRNVSISLAGSSFSSGDIRDLISSINDELGDGVTLGVTG